MIFKTLSIYCCALLILSPSVARCHSDVPFVTGEPKLVRPSAPGFRSVHERFARNDHIDHAKPMLNNVADTSTTDYQKFRIEPLVSTRRAGSGESNVNVNVNHHDSSMPRWNKKNSNRSSHRPNSRQHHEQKLERMLQMVHMMPNANIDYNLSHPHGNVKVRKRKNSKHKSIPHISREDSEQSESYEDIESKCYQLVDDALEYLRSVQIRLDSLEQELILLTIQLREKDSDQDSHEFEYK